eukprot:218839-Chlamydomonas_euryale.AAC.14
MSQVRSLGWAIAAYRAATSAVGAASAAGSEAVIKPQCRCGPNGQTATATQSAATLTGGARRLMHARVLVLGHGKVVSKVASCYAARAVPGQTCETLPGPAHSGAPGACAPPPPPLHIKETLVSGITSAAEGIEAATEKVAEVADKYLGKGEQPKEPEQPEQV